MRGVRQVEPWPTQAPSPEESTGSGQGALCVWLTNATQKTSISIPRTVHRWPYGAKASVQMGRVKDLAVGGLSWVFQGGPQCNHSCPHSSGQREVCLRWGRRGRQHVNPRFQPQKAHLTLASGNGREEIRAVFSPASVVGHLLERPRDTSRCSPEMGLAGEFGRKGFAPANPA